MNRASSIYVLCIIYIIPIKNRVQEFKRKQEGYIGGLGRWDEWERENDLIIISKRFNIALLLP